MNAAEPIAPIEIDEIYKKSLLSPISFLVFRDNSLFFLLTSIQTFVAIK